MKGLLRLFCGLFILSLLFSLSIPSAFAEPVDSTRQCSLNLQATYAGEPVTAMPFSLYRVAEVSGSAADFRLLAPYSTYPISLDGLEGEDWALLAQSLSAYVRADHPTPQAQGLSDAEGKLFLDGLPCGLYLVCGDRVSQNGSVYSAAPFLVCLPTLADGSWSYALSAKPKLSREENNVSLRVLKIWDDAGAESARPTQIAVTLLCDGEVYERVILTERNSWRWHWRQLEGGHNWSVIEEPVEGYSVSIMLIDDCYCITNHRSSHVPPPTPSTPPNKLPQTGLNWWPVVGFGCAGVLLLALAVVAKRIGRRKEDGQNVQ